MKKEEEKKETPPDQQAMEDSPKVTILQLFRFAEYYDKVFMIIGSIASLGVGVMPIIMCVVFGGMIDSFKESKSSEETFNDVKRMSVYMIYIALGTFFFSCFSESFWTLVGEKLGVRVRCLYFETILKKDIPWFDTNRPQELPAKLSSLASKYQSGIGEKIGKVEITISMAISGLVGAFVFGWQMALVLIVLSPITILAARLISFATQRGARTQKAGYTKCGGYAEEALSAIRTVYAYCAEEYEKNKYLNELENAQQVMIKNSFIMGIAVGLINLSMALSNGCGFFVGSFFIEYDVHNYFYGEPYSSGNIMTVFMAALFAMFSMGGLGPQLQVVGDAQIAAYEIYETVDSGLQIDQQAAGSKIDRSTFKGKIL